MYLFDFIDCIRSEYPEIAVEVYRMNDPSMPAGALAIGGFYCPEEGVELAIYTDNRTEFIDETAHSLEDLVAEIAVTLKHEMRHHHQYAARDFEEFTPMAKSDFNSDIKYLGNFDEIDAYGNVDLPEFVKKNGWADAYSSKFSILNRYLVVFGKNHPIVKKLIKKAYIALNS